MARRKLLLILVAPFQILIQKRSQRIQILLLQTPITIETRSQILFHQDKNTKDRYKSYIRRAELDQLFMEYQNVQGVNELMIHSMKYDKSFQIPKLYRKKILSHENIQSYKGNQYLT